MSYRNFQVRLKLGGIALIFLISSVALCWQSEPQIQLERYKDHVIVKQAAIAKFPIRFASQLPSWECKPILYPGETTNKAGDSMQPAWFRLYRKPSETSLDFDKLNDLLQEDLRKARKKVFKELNLEVPLSAASDTFPSEPDFVWYTNPNTTVGSYSQISRGSATELPANSPGIAVLDSGIQKDNPVFLGRLWPRHAEFAFPPGTNQTCGKVDLGYDATNDAKPFLPDDSTGHGTHCSGVMIKHPGFFLIDCKVVRNDGAITTDAVVSALQFVHEAKIHDTNVKVVSMSFGGLLSDVTSDGRSLPEAIKLVNDDNILIVCSAGNGHENSDLYSRIPAVYSIPSDDFSNVLTVASVGYTPLAANPFPFSRTSNYGQNSVQLCAVGENVLAPSLHAGHDEMVSGTSISAADVSGIAGTLFAVRSQFANNPKLIKWILISTATREHQLAPLVLLGGVVNESQALSLRPGSLTGDQIFLKPGFISVTSQDSRDINLFSESYEVSQNRTFDYAPRDLPVNIRITRNAGDRVSFHVQTTGAQPGLYHILFEAKSGDVIFSSTTLTIAVHP